MAITTKITLPIPILPLSRLSLVTAPPPRLYQTTHFSNSIQILKKATLPAFRAIKGPSFPSTDPEDMDRDQLLQEVRTQVEMITIIAKGLIDELNALGEHTRISKDDGGLGIQKPILIFQAPLQLEGTRIQALYQKPFPPQTLQLLKTLVPDFIEMYQTLDFIKTEHSRINEVSWLKAKSVKQLGSGEIPDVVLFQKLFGSEGWALITEDEAEKKKILVKCLYIMVELTKIFDRAVVAQELASDALMTFDNCVKSMERIF